MKNLATKKTRNLLRMFILLFSVMLFTISCSNDDDDSTDDSSTINNTELTINDYLLIATGQTTLYDADGNVLTSISEGEAYFGQDANYLAGEIMSYTNNDDGTITDENSGLMWQQVPTSETFTWQEAMDYCDDLVFAGYDDWRAPTLKELFSISDFSSGWPYIDTSYFTLASGQITKDEQYWANNYYVGVTVEGGSDAAFGVNHVTGHIKAYAANSTGPIGGKYVRAVRGGSYGNNDYVDNGDGTVSDNNTGLMWAQDDDAQTYDWEQALTYAEASDLAGYSDWRLPNVKEMQSIVDYSRSPSATDASSIGPAIDPIFSCTPMVNEAGDDDYGYYWTSTSASFTSGEPYYYAWYVAMGRAVNDEGDDFHGAGAVRFDTKHENGPAGEDAERYYNYVRLVRDIN